MEPIVQPANPTIHRKPKVDALKHDELSQEGKKFDGPLSRPMWLKIKSLNSKLSDTFNWSIYDDLYIKYGEHQPRGGVVFRTGLKLVNHHSSCSKCHYAFEIDTYGRGCVHNCVYCYALESLTGHGMWNRPHPFPLDMSEIRKEFYTAFETDKKSRWREILLKRIPLRIGSMSDSFMKMDIKYGVTKELLRILSFYNYPYIVFTRSDLIARDQYISLLRKDLASIQFSISGNNEKLTRLIEPGAPSVAARLSALRDLNKAGFWTTVRINPFFPTHPDGFFTKSESVIQRFGSLERAPTFDLFDWTFIDQIKETNTPSLLVGVVRLSPHGLRAVSKATGIDLRSFFRPDAINGNRDVRYSDIEVAWYYRKFYGEARRRGLRFNTCYIGMGLNDYFQYQDLWSNKKDCCDAVGNVNHFSSTCQGIAWNRRLKYASDKGSAIKAKSEELTMDQFYSDLDTVASKQEDGTSRDVHP